MSGECTVWVPQDPNVPNTERERCTAQPPHAHSDPHSAGLHARYRVEKMHDPTGKHADCRYFVLDPQHDPLARVALAAYADAAEKAGRPRSLHRALVLDLRAWLRRCGHLL